MLRALKKTILCSGLIPAFGLAVHAQGKGFPLPKIPFQPRNYTCQRAEPTPVIDGKLDDEAWIKARWTEDFVDIQGDLKPKPRLRTRAKFLWDDQYLYVAAELEEPRVWGTLTERDSVVFRDNDFEVFLDPDSTGGPYFEFEMNALNTVWDLLILRPYRSGGRVAVDGWDFKGLKSAVSIQGTLNRHEDQDRGWTVEVALPLASIAEIAGRHPRPKPGDRWRVNLSRVQWQTDVKDGRLEKRRGSDGQRLPEDNWVWSPQGLVDMHYPEMWGFLVFSGRGPGAPEPLFDLLPEDQVRWALRRIHYAQQALIADQKMPGGTLQELGLSDLRLPRGWRIHLEAGERTWHAEALGKGRISIDPAGIIRSE